MSVFVRRFVSALLFIITAVRLVVLRSGKFAGILFGSLREPHSLKHATAFLLIVVLLAPLTGPFLEANAATRRLPVQPKVEMAAELLAPPLPYSFPETKFDLPPAPAMPAVETTTVSSATAAVWESVTRLFDFFTSSEKTAESPVNFESETVTALPNVTYNLVGDYSTTTNPAGVWTYGYLDTANNFSAFTGSGYQDSLFAWSKPAGGFCCPVLGKNMTGANYTTFNTVVIPPDLLVLYPNSNGEKTVVRWTAPANGTYQIDFRFQGMDSVGVSADTWVVRNNQQSIFAAPVSGHGTPVGATPTLQMAAGETLDFAIGAGANNNNSNDFIGLGVIITGTTPTPTPTPTPPPGAVPSAPIIAQVQAISPSRLDVYWNQPPAAENVTSFNLRVNGGQIIPNIVSLSHPVTGLAAGTTYSFEVQAVNQYGASGWSQPASGTTPAAPTPTPTPPPAASYNLVNDYSTTTNPAGVWTYGYLDTSHNFSAFTGNGVQENLFVWSKPAGGTCCPAVAKNMTGANYTVFNTVVVPPDLLLLLPNNNGERSVVRWTAPANGTYQIDFRFQGLDSVGVTTDVSVVRNGQSQGAFTGQINGSGTPVGATPTFQMTAGETLDFIVSAGANNNNSNDFTGLGVAITNANAPPTPTPNITPTPTPVPTATPTPNPTPTPTPTIVSTAEARQRPLNQTGGMDLYSRNFGWSTGLAGLSGRGIDAGFGISYNSLVWLKQGGEMIFNPNNDNVTPGFRFGYPVIEQPYADSLTGKNTYLMVTPSGGRIGFRQVGGTTDTFETADSSYLQLKVTSANTLLVTGTDGTQMIYELKGGSFKCSQIKDANGNYITINHDSSGKLQSVTDTLGRVINVTYDGNGLPLAITQARAGGLHTYATFTYAMQVIGTNFSGLNLVGITNGASIPVLQKITYADNSSTRFEYNSYGQVFRTSSYAGDGLSKLSHTATNLDVITAQPQTDAPRFTEIKSWVQNFNFDANGVPQETVIPVGYQENQGFALPDGAQGTGTLVQIAAPDGTVSKTFYGASGWLEGLPLVTEDWAGGNRMRWSRTVYTQDDPNLAYILNPRSTESKIGDVNNVRRSTVDYRPSPNNPQASFFGLAQEVKVYDADGTTVLKRSVTDYNLDANYLARRIIGLPLESKLFDQNNALVSRATYAYDEGNFGDPGQSIAPIQHDDTNFGAGLTAGRGNMTSTTRWDVAVPTDANRSVTARIKYDTAGSPVASVDPLGRTIRTAYTDSFEDNQNRNTFAYPTVITDPAGNSSTVKYRFDIGANIYATSPAPAGNAAGKTSERTYDNLGRLLLDKIVNTGVYTRYEYPTNSVQSLSYATVADTNGNGADAADEIASESYTDGAGRTLRSRTEHPGSSGGWSGTYAEYDIMGRVRRSSMPTEVNNLWQPAGDDAGLGWRWMAKEYDWKGRVTREIDTTAATDKLYSYEGCGCAGGQVTTVQGELLPEGRRRQKVYEDILGRSFKSETLNWDGSVYSTVKTNFNGRDQATLVTQFAGAENAAVSQVTEMTYDGHGRLATEHRPEQNPGTATVFTYNTDDTVQIKTDGRGATSAYTYDNRKLVTQINYQLNGGTTPPPAQTNNSLPIGFLDGVDATNRKVWGWSLDPDSPATSNAIHFYIDGAQGAGGTFIGSVTANQARSDVNANTNQPGNHGFEFQLPNQYLNGAQHSIYAYGMDNGTPGKSLLGTPKTFTIGTPPALPVPNAPTIAQAQAVSASQIDVYWNQSPASEQVTSYNLRINGAQTVPNISALSFQVTGLAASTTYTFEVSANNATGTSAWSAAASATTFGNPTPTPTPEITPTPSPEPTPTPGGQSCYGEPPQVCPIDWTWDPSICGCREGGGLSLRSGSGRPVQRRPDPGDDDPSNPDPPDPGSPTGRSPLGNLDGANASDRSMVGWSYDPDNPGASNIVHFYLNGPAGTGQYIGSAAANEPRPDVNTAFSIPGQHGFRFQVPLEYQNGNQYSVYAYGIDTGTDAPAVLQGSPKTFSFINTPPAAPTSSTVTFAYDALGSRTSMTDANGTVTYEYDQLSRLTAETRSFAGENLPNAPAGNSFRLGYAYTMSGQLASLTDPYGQQINYGHDKAGRLQSVTGSSFGGVTNYASSPHYRAWGGLQNLTYGNGVQMNLGFNNRSQVASYTLVGAGASQGTNIMQKAYQYNNDGSLRYADDQIDDRFDRLNAYDQVGRIISGKSGAEARGGTVAEGDQSTQLPYRQSYAYNAFGNLTQRNNKHWGVEYWYGQSNNLSYNYQNNRVQGAAYDADGRMTVTSPTDGYTESTYDATGQLTRLYDATSSDIYRNYDGNGREVKRRKLRWEDNPYSPTNPFGHWVDEGNTFYIRSSILGNETITEVDLLGRKIKSFVKANGATLATQSIVGTTQTVDFEHYDASGMSYRTTGAGGGYAAYTGTVFSPGELDPFGGNTGLETPYVEPLRLLDPPPDKFDNQTNFLLDGGEQPMYVNGQKVTATIDGMSVPLSVALQALGSGAAMFDRNAPPLPGQLASSLGYIANYEGDVNVPDDPDNLTVNVQMGGTTYTQVGSPNLGTWDARMQRPEQLSAGGGESGGQTLNTGKIATSPSDATEKKCLAKLGATGFTFDFDETNQIKIAKGFLDGKPITIKTYFARNNSEQLGRAQDDLNTKYTGKRQSGLTLASNPLSNDIAVDVATNGAFPQVAKHALYAHELGNALALQKYKEAYGKATGEQRDKMTNPLESSYPATAQGDQDPGVAFERCLYEGKIVGLRTGRLGNSREF